LQREFSADKSSEQRWIAVVCARGIQVFPKANVVNPAFAAVVLEIDLVWRRSSTGIEPADLAQEAGFIIGPELIISYQPLAQGIERKASAAVENPRDVGRSGKRSTIVGARVVGEIWCLNYWVVETKGDVQRRPIREIGYLICAADRVQGRWCPVEWTVQQPEITGGRACAWVDRLRVVNKPAIGWGPKALLLSGIRWK
jgi:hypothetical protein